MIETNKERRSNIENLFLKFRFETFSSLKITVFPEIFSTSISLSFVSAAVVVAVGSYFNSTFIALPVGKPSFAGLLQNSFLLNFYKRVSFRISL